MTTTLPNKTQLKVTLGSDPELMLYDNQQGRIVSAIPVLRHDKHNPIDLGCGIKMYSDNVLVEFSFPPVDTKAQFIAQLASVFKRGREYLGPRYSLVAKSAHDYPESELSDKAAKESGCSPNYDVYTESMNPPAAFNGGLRTGSFHLHVGNADYLSGNGPMLDFDSRNLAIRLFDIIVGCGGVVMDGDPTSCLRRSLYGKAGEFRPTDYGIEYRCLGPYALRSPETVALVMDLVDFAVERLADGTAGDIVDLMPHGSFAANAINGCDWNLAIKALSDARMPGILIDKLVSISSKPFEEVTW